MAIDIFTVLILLFDFVVSIWNGYASGYNIGMCRKNNIEGFQKYASYAGLGLGFAGMAYVLVIVLAFAASALGYVSSGTATVALAYDFLVLGLLIIGFGMLVTVQSIIIAYRQRSIWSILVAVYNIFAELWDIYAYMQGFREAVALVKGGDNRQQSDALVIVLVAVLIAFFIEHAAYRHGCNKAMGVQPEQQVRGYGTRMMGSRVRRISGP